MEQEPHSSEGRRGTPNPMVGSVIVIALLLVDVFATRAVLAAEARAQVSSTGSLFLVTAVLLLSMSALTYVVHRHLGRVHASSRPGGRRRDHETPD